MYKFVVSLHIAISAAFIVVSIIVLLRAAIAYSKGVLFSNSDKTLSLIFILLLYMQFILGVSLYLFFMPKLSDPVLSLEEAQKLSEMQFWVIEHLSIMLFSTIIAVIGRIFIKQSNDSKRKHRNTLIYYGITFIFVIFSMLLALYKEM